MQFFDRGSVPPPKYLQSREAQRDQVMLLDYFRSSAKKIEQTSAPRVELNLNDPSILESLERLFHGKCSFCEAKVSTETYRFRPAAEASPFASEHNGHLYYVWLAGAWDNLYSICSTCRPERPDYFPVRGRRAPLPRAADLDRYVEEGLGLWGSPIAERPLFLDPCAKRSFYKHIQVRLDGQLSGLSDEGAETITHFHLDRRERAEMRAAQFATYLSTLHDTFATGTQPRAGAPQPFGFAVMEFGGAWYLLLRRLALVLGASSRGRTLSPVGIRGFYEKLARGRDFAGRLHEALSRIQEEDAGEVPVRHAPRAPSGGRARLVSVELKNFKAIEFLRLEMPPEKRPTASSTELPAPALLILGENAAGKSSILEAIALALIDDAARADLDLESGMLVLNPAFLGAESAGGPDLATVTATFDSSAPRTLDIGEAGFRERPPLGSDIPPVFAYGAFRQFLDRERRYSPAKHVKNLFQSDTLLSNPEKWLLGLPEDRFSMVVRALRSILSIEGDFDVIERDTEGQRCLVVAEAELPTGMRVPVKTPLVTVSSGFRAVLAMVCDVMRGLMDPRVHASFESLTVARAVVLIDEVEAHLHPRWKMQIMRGLRTALPSVTFIATTHDPLCLRGMEDGEVVVLQRAFSGVGGAASNYPAYIEKLVELPSVTQLTVEQLLTSDFFQLFSTDAPVLERMLARVADLLARRASGSPLNAEEQATLAAFEADVASALPVGSSEVHRLVQEAVAEFLRTRRTAPAMRLPILREETKQRIRAALEAVS